jgi:GNAT superfamily N-acetyltransferase
MPLVIRQARLEDAAGIAHVHVDTWKTTYAGIIPDAYLAAMDEETYAARWREQLSTGPALIFVAETIAEAGGSGTAGMIGFACAGDARQSRPGYDAELYTFYVLRQFQRMGVGRALFHAIVNGLQAKGHTAIILWALEANTCLPFYERLGGLRIARQTIEIGGANLQDIAFGWPDLNTLLELHPSESKPDVH